MNKKHSSRSFQDVWLSDDHFRAWVGKTGNKKEACCVVCKRNTDISAMESSALHSHASSKKHKEHMTAYSKCVTIDLFFNKLCFSGSRKSETTTAQHNTGTMKEMLIINQEWCYQCRDHVVSAIFTWKNKMQVHDTIWNCSLVQIWIVESYQFIAILFFIIGWRLKFHTTKMSDGWLTHDFRTMKPTF